MASKQLLKSRKSENSASSSTTSSSKLFHETSIDGGQSSPASSSVKSKLHQHLFSESAELSKENVTVTVRFRPLSPKEIRQGEEIAWYADGNTIVRNEHNPSIGYAYDRVFGPTRTTRHVYDVAAHHIVNGAMEGINGTIFAYGVTSSGKTHTMHGDQRSPGIIPLAVKDAFSIIQDTPCREFLLHVSYIEIYNEVVNDLLNPAGQNLRIREDQQGILVEGVKQEVVLSPAHALSLIAAGEEHRHVGSTNFYLLSSRSHTIFTLTVESSACGEHSEGEAVNLAQLHLIDMAGSESSKAETTVTPASSNSEETHNTLKFAHRAKCIEIQAAQNKIVDEKSLIKKYQNEIHMLREELGLLKKGIVISPEPKSSVGEDIILLRQKLKDGQVELQSRLEQEDEAKAALLSRIQRLKKLILVSTKSPQPSRLPHQPGPRRRHSFGEEELAYLPHKKRDLILDNGNFDLYINQDGKSEIPDEAFKEEKKSRKNGLLNWLKNRKKDGGIVGGTIPSEKLSKVKLNSTPSSHLADSVNFHAESSLSLSPYTGGTNSAEFSPGTRKRREIPEDNFSGGETPLTIEKPIDQIDLFREQKKILSEEIGLHSSALKHLSEEAAKNPEDDDINEQVTRLIEEVRAKNEQIGSLEKQIADIAITNHDKMDKSEMAQTIAELVNLLNDKSFELEVKTADNRIIQDQLNQKISECETLQTEISSLKQELSDALEFRKVNPFVSNSPQHSRMLFRSGGIEIKKKSPLFKDATEKLLLHTQVTEIEELRQTVSELNDLNNLLEQRNKKLGEESTYAKGLASAAAVELKALSEEVAQLMNQNERLSSELASLRSPPTQSRSVVAPRNGRRESLMKRHDHISSTPTSDLKKEFAVRKERKLAYEAALQEKDQREAELEMKLEESKQREAYLENELANMWVLVAKLKRSQGADSDASEMSRETPRSDNCNF